MSHTQSIVDFVRGIGIDVQERSLPDSTFLPGVAIERGQLVIDQSKLSHPGDVLHEAGHLAVTSPSERPVLSDKLSCGGGEEMAAIAWSFAAILHLNIDPAVLFHDEGYKGGAASLLENFSAGRYIGVPLLEWYGMTCGPGDPSAGQEYPKMACWLRSTENASTAEQEA